MSVTWYANIEDVITDVINLLDDLHDYPHTLENVRRFEDQASSISRKLYKEIDRLKEL